MVQITTDKASLVFSLTVTNNYKVPRILKEVITHSDLCTYHTNLKMSKKDVSYGRAVKTKLSNPRRSIKLGFF